MKRETRANLIFLGVFLAVSIPGAILLFKKKLQPGQNMMYLPDTVRTSLPYMDPTPTPPQIKRVAPPITLGWVKQLVTQKLGADANVAQGDPLMSDARMFQHAGGAADAMLLIVWDPRCGPDGAYDLKIDGKGSSFVERNEELLPPEVRKELQDQGYIRPPQKVTALIVRPKPPAGRLTLECRSGDVVIRDSMETPLH